MRKEWWRLVLAVFVLGALAAAGHAAVWQELQPMGQVRAEPAVVVMDGKLWVFGGRDYGTGSTFASVEMYDPKTDMWEMRAPMPDARCNPAAAICGDNIYVFGGSIGPAKFRNTWIYDPALDTWSTGADIPGAYADDGRVDASAICVNKEIWLVGGYDGSSQLSRVDIYDPVADSWRSGPSLTHPAQDPFLFEYHRMLYALPTMWSGGVEVCDPNAALPSWTEIAVLDAHHWGVWASVGNKAYGIGYGSPYHDVIVYRAPNNTWYYADPSPAEYPVTATSAAVIGKTIYIPGGLVLGETTNRLLTYSQSKGRGKGRH